jgi:hypothetical protein
MSNAQYFLLQLKGRAKEFGAIQIPSPSYPQQLSMDLEKGLKMQKRNLRTFVWGADSLDSLIRFFDEAYLLGPVKEVHAIVNKLKETEASDDVPDVPADIRDGFNSMRGMIVRFLQDYELFVTQVSNWESIASKLWEIGKAGIIYGGLTLSRLRNCPDLCQRSKLFASSLSETQSGRCLGGSGALIFQ